MIDLLQAFISAPVANVLILLGGAFIFVAVVGNIAGKVEPGRVGRIVAALVGAPLLVIGILAQLPSHGSPPGRPKEPTTSGGGEATTAGAGQGTGVTGPGFRVIEVMLRADPFDYAGPCPVTIRFSGRISAVGGAGTVSYRFLRSDGASAPVQTVLFDSPGSKDVSETWQLGGAGFTYSGWEAIKVLEPQETESNHATFKVRCQ